MASIVCGMDVIEELLENNRRYVRQFDKGALSSSPQKRVAVLTCMDARLDVHKILGLHEGDAHVIRNAGGIASEDALRSLVISQRLLGTDAVVVIHHTDCGMLTLPEDEMRREVEEETGQPLPFGLHAFSDLQQETISAIMRIREAPFLPHRDPVRGFIYNVETGLLREVDGGVHPTKHPRANGK